MHRRRWWQLLILAVVAGGLLAPLGYGQQPPGSQIDGLDLRKQLAQGLRARRPVEFDYVDQVVDLVDKGKLPRPLVDSTYGWARRQPKEPLQYFAFALRERAKKAGYEAPPPPT